MLFHYAKLILWWNPLIWLLSNIIEDACEYRCDSVVTKTMDDLSKVNYASLINRFSIIEINTKLLLVGSTYAHKKEKDYIFLRITAFLKPEPLRLSSKITCLAAISIIIIGSVIFTLPTVTQENYLVSVERNMEATADSGYFIKNADGSYSLYNYGMLIDDDITDISNYNLPIEEEVR